MLSARRILEAIFERTGRVMFANPACVICGGRGGKGETSLCPLCEARIPWIEQIACEVCGRGEPCPDCLRRRLPPAFCCSRSAVRYNREMKAWLARYKFRGDEQLRAVFASMMAKALNEFIKHELQPEGKSIDLLTYVPLSPRRLEERGFNQAQQLAAELSRKFNIPLLPMLRKIRHTDKQSEKTRRERIVSSKGVYQLLDGAASAARQQVLAKHHARHQGNINIVVVDDVYTTGSTLNACAMALEAEIEANIFGLTWAR